MGTLKHLLIASAIITAGMIFGSVSGAVAGDYERCREVQSSNLRNFNMCLDRYNLPRVSRNQFRNIVGSDDFYYRPHRERRHYNRRHRERRYIYGNGPAYNYDVPGIIITFGGLTVMFK